MHFSRIDKHDTAHRCHVMASAIGKLLRALLNHSYRIALVDMGSKSMRYIARMEQLQITQSSIMPKLDTLMCTHNAQVAPSIEMKQRYSIIAYKNIAYMIYLFNISLHANHKHN